MTAVLTRPVRSTPTRRRVWLSTRRAHVVLGWGWHNTRKRLADGEAHAHKNRTDRAGEWLIAADVAAAARRGACLSEQVRLCGCRAKGWSPPPCRVGGGRRTPL